MSTAGTSDYTVAFGDYACLVDGELYAMGAADFAAAYQPAKKPR